MKKLLLISAATLIVSNSTFAGGILTNTNQHAAFLRMLSRGATTEIDGALSNPAGLAFLPKDGFHVGLSIQSAYQTRNIDASFMTYNGVNATGPTVADKPFEKYYEGTAAAPVIPSLFAAYKKGEWTISGFFAITAGGGKASFDDGLPMFDASAMAGIFQEGLKAEKPVILTPEAAKSLPLTELDRMKIQENRKIHLVGTPAVVADKLLQEGTTYGFDEAMIVSITHSQEKRLNTYRLLAKEMI